MFEYPVLISRSSILKALRALRTEVARADAELGHEAASKLLHSCAISVGTAEPILCTVMSSCEFLAPTRPDLPTFPPGKCAWCPLADQSTRGFVSPVEHIDNAIAMFTNHTTRELFLMATGYQFDLDKVKTTRSRLVRMRTLIQQVRLGLDALTPSPTDGDHP